MPAFKSIAFVGQSGAGKTTIANLICLLLKPTKGNIFINDHDASEIELGSWRDQIGYVSQETTIFDDSIANNIALSFGPEENNKNIISRIKESARLANIDKFIEKLPHGYQTLVGGNGLKLSGGQRQRIFIARELFRKPKILILDEATSALDTKTKNSILDTLLKDNELTVIMITHDLEIANKCKFVYRLDKGKIYNEK